MPDVTHRINIPSRPPVETQAAGIVIDAMRECGIDPYKVANHDLAKEIALVWARGEMTRDEAMHSWRMLMIMNPSLKAGGRCPT